MSIQMYLVESDNYQVVLQLCIPGDDRAHIAAVEHLANLSFDPNYYILVLVKILVRRAKSNVSLLTRRIACLSTINS